MAKPNHSAATETIGESVNREIAEAHTLLETYRAQIEQCEKLKVELDLIHDAINRTKREIAVLHGKSFNGQEMAKVNGELGAVSAAPRKRPSRFWRPPSRSTRPPARSAR
jgi:chemotaxis protein CheZ